jgi:hypothetical protein
VWGPSSVTPPRISAPHPAERKPQPRAAGDLSTGHRATELWSWSHHGRPQSQPAPPQCHGSEPGSKVAQPLPPSNHGSQAREACELMVQEGLCLCAAVLVTIMPPQEPLSASALHTHQLFTCSQAWKAGAGIRLFLLQRLREVN